MTPTRRAASSEWRLTVAGRAILFLAALGVLPSFVIGGDVASIPALAFGAMAASAWIGWRNVQGLELGVQPVLRASATSRTTLPTSIRNPNRTTRRDFVIRHRTPGDRNRSTPRGFVAELPARETLELRCAHRVGARGAHERHRATVETTYPLGLVERRLEFELPVDHLVRPAIGELRGSLLEELRAIAVGVEWGRRQGRDELDGLRPWREGESMRDVHWRATARSGRLVARQMTGDERPPLLLCLSPTIVGRRNVRRSRAVEEAISLTATIVKEARRRSLNVELVVLGDRSTRLDLGVGRKSVEAALDLLARVEARVSESIPRIEPPRRRRGGAAWLIGPGAMDAPRFDLVLNTDKRDLDLVFKSPIGPEEQVLLG